MLHDIETIDIDLLDTAFQPTKHAKIARRRNALNRYKEAAKNLAISRLAGDLWADTWAALAKNYMGMYQFTDEELSDGDSA